MKKAFNNVLKKLILYIFLEMTLILSIINVIFLHSKEFTETLNINLHKFLELQEKLTKKRT